MDTPSDHEYLDRASAIEEALRDLARDLEADLGKAARFRGNSEAGPFRDPGANVAELAKQRAEHTPPTTPLFESYRARAAVARDWPTTPRNPAEWEARDRIFTLIDRIVAVSTHTEAADLVATFPKEI